MDNDHTEGDEELQPVLSATSAATQRTPGRSSGHDGHGTADAKSSTTRQNQIQVLLVAALCITNVAVLCLTLIQPHRDSFSCLLPEAAEAIPQAQTRSIQVPNNTSTSTRTSTNHHLAAGVDPSEALSVEDGGGVFRRYEDGSVAPALQIVKENGYEWIRLRLMVDPNGQYGLSQDLSYVLRMARQAKAIGGFQVLLDLHYSDWWADGNNQWMPGRWKDTADFEALKNSVYDYTYRVLQVLKDEEVLPHAVQIGNEISAGMLWPYGKLPKGWNHNTTDLPQEWYNLKDLIQSGIDAINDVVSNNPDERPLIVLHLDKGDQDFTELWLRTYFSLGGICDVIGLSWYLMWQGPLEKLRATIDNLSLQFPDKQVWVVETAYYFEGWCDPSLNLTDNVDVDVDVDVATNADAMEVCHRSEQGQYDFLRAMREMLLTTKCRAVFYWGSHWSQPDKWFHAPEQWNNPEKRALFDSTGRALKGIRALPGF